MINLFIIVTFFIGLPLLEKYLVNEHKYTMFGKIFVHIFGFTSFLLFYSSCLFVRIVEKIHSKILKEEYRSKFKD